MVISGKYMKTFLVFLVFSVKKSIKSANGNFRPVKSMLFDHNTIF